MAKPPAVIANDRAALRIWPFVFLGVLLLFLWLSWSTKHGWVLIWAMICAAAVGLSCLEAIRWQRMHHLRQKAAREGMRAGVPLARPQPIPTGEVLPVPFTITLQPQWFRVLAFTVLVGLVAIIFTSSAAAGGTFDLYADWPTALSFGLFYGTLFSWRLYLPQRIVVSADGLLVRHPLLDWWVSNWQMGERFIPWSEARLFAIRSSQPGTPATRYELSSATRVVPFGRARRSRWWALYRPVIPWQDYNFQMDALLDVIVTKTGLPLYDVRSGRTSGSPRRLWGDTVRLLC